MLQGTKEFRSLEEFRRHKKVTLYKNYFSFLKKNVDICAECQEIWPCGGYLRSAEQVANNLEELMNEWEYHTNVTNNTRSDMHELRRRIRVAEMILSGKSPEALKESSNQIGVHVSDASTSE